MRTRLHSAVVVGLVVVGILAAGCADSPVAPDDRRIDLTGNWTGSASDTTGFGDMRWHIEQTGGTLAGEVEFTDRGVNINGRGSVTGTLTDGTLQFTLAVPAGGLDAPYDTCTTTVSGQATAGTTSISGTYTGTSSCSGRIYSGQLVLRRI